MEVQKFYLEKECQFWEVTRTAEKTVIRAGKIGKPGRKFPEKNHKTVHQAKQFARRQVNGKIIQGFQDPEVVVPRAPMLKLLSKRSSIRIKNRLLSQQRLVSPLVKDNNSQKPVCKETPSLTKDETIRINSTTCVKKFKSSLNQEESIYMTKHSVNSKPQWRKPPKKQSTVRRRARQESIIQRANAALSKKQISLSKLKTIRLTDKQKTTDFLKTMDSMPELEKRHSSWKMPRLSGPDLSMPRLSKD